MICSSPTKQRKANQLPVVALLLVTCSTTSQILCGRQTHHESPLRHAWKVLSKLMDQEERSVTGEA